MNAALAWLAEDEALVSLAYGIFFACPVCYKIQAQGGSSSSVHLAGAANIFFPRELICKFHKSFHTFKIGWNFGCLSKPLTVLVLLPV